MTNHQSNLDLPRMQMLLEPMHGRVLRALQALLLRRILLVPLGREPVRQAGEVLVIILDIQRGDGLVGVLLQFGGECGVVFGREDLDGDADLVDLGLLEEGGVGGGDAVDDVVAYRSRVQIEMSDLISTAGESEGKNE